MSKALSDLKLKRFESSDALDEALSLYVSDILKKEIDKKGTASMIVSGGSTPKGLYKRLSSMNLPWEKVWITLADERWVDTKHEDSNERMLQELLLTNKAAKANFIGLKTQENSPKEAENSCTQKLKAFPAPATICLLGMGEDGHTASLFPHSAELPCIIYENQLTCKACTPMSTPYKRMTLTPQFIGQSKNIILHIVGQKKLQVMQEALEQNDIFSMPIRLFLSNPRMEVYCS